MADATNTQKVVMHVEAKDSAGNTIPITGTPNWTSLDPSIATVDPTGTAVTVLPVDGATGSVDITVTVQGLSAVTTVNITAGIASLVIVVDGVIPK